MGEWAWTVYGKGSGAIRISVEREDFARYVKGLAVPGVAGSVTYSFLHSGVRPQFLEPFNNLTNEDRDEYHLFFHKHGFYNYEAEYRIVLFQQGPVTREFPDGLIRSVSLSPSGPPNEEVGSLLKSRFGVQLR
jgi:hypothetical protein